MEMKTRGHIRFIIVFLALTALFLAKLNKGFPSFDEALYITLPWRFLNGDSMFLDELIGMQMSSFLLLPFMKLFLLIRSNLDYVVLYFRFLYFIFQALICIGSYYIMNKNRDLKNIGAICVLFYAYVPFWLMAMSYNTIPLSLLFFSCAIILSDNVDKVFYSVLLGICLACIILCQPGCVLLYLIWLSLVIIKPSDKGVFSRKNFTVATVAALSIGVIFLAYVFHRADMQDIIASARLMGRDTEHLADNMLLERVFFIDALPWIKRPHVLAFILVWGAVFVADFIFLRINSKKCAKPRMIEELLFFIGSLASGRYLLYQAFVLAKQIGMSAIMSPLAPLGLFCWIHLSVESKKKYNNYFLAWVISLVYMYCNHLMSNNTPHVISLGFMISSLVSIPIINLFWEERREYTLFHRKMILCIVISVQLLAEMIIYYNNVYNDDEYANLTYYVDRGPAKGLYTNQTRYINYLYTLKDLDEIQEMQNGNALTYIDMDMLLNGGPIYYLYMNNKISPPMAYSGKEIFLKGSILDSFYSQRPDKVPNVVFIPAEVMANENTAVTKKMIRYVSEKYNMSVHEFRNAAVSLTNAN